MSWLCSRALVVAFLGEDCSDGDVFALLKSNPIVGKSSRKGKTKDTLKPSPFGMTCEHLTDIPGAEKWMLSAEDFRVLIFQPLAKVPESKAKTPASGLKWQESLAKYDPDSRSWKTRQFSLLGGLIEFSATFPNWGTMQSGVLFLLPIPERLIYESASGYLHTPTAKANQMSPSMIKKGSGYFQSPTAMDASPMTGGKLYKTKNGTVRAKNPDGTSSNRGLAAQVNWPTPNASDHRDRGHRQSPVTKKRMAKGKQINLSASVSDVSGQLNPTWVAWLMGWPIGWTDSKPLETDKFQEWLQQHG